MVRLLLRAAFCCWAAGAAYAACKLGLRLLGLGLRLRRHVHVLPMWQGPMTAGRTRCCWPAWPPGCLHTAKRRRRGPYLHPTPSLPSLHLCPRCLSPAARVARPVEQPVPRPTELTASEKDALEQVGPGWAAK